MRYRSKIVAEGRIVTVVAVIFILASCAHVYSASKQETSRIVKVSEGIYRGPRLDDLNELQSLKINTILNLEDNAEAIQKESEAAKQLGMVMINIPMSEISRPKPDDLLRAVKILEDQDSHPIYVHCLHGRDRTGFVIAAYRIVHHGWTVEKAYQEAIDNGHNRWFYDLILGWKESLWLIANGKTGVQAIP
jgi:protein tyrosine/serine phosphatase